MYRLLLCVTLMVTACGGGGGGATAPASQPGATYSIAGVVAAANGGGLAGVQVGLSGAATSSTVSDANGAYTFTGLSDGSYVVTPTAAGKAFTPASAIVSVQGLSMSGNNFTQGPQSLPSTQLIADYMAIRRSQSLSTFAADEQALGNALSAQGGFQSGAHYIRSGQDYVTLVQAFANDSLAFVRTKAQTSAIDRIAISSLLSTYAGQDASYADIYYHGVPWGLSANGVLTFVEGINTQTNDIYALTILQLP